MLQTNTHNDKYRMQGDMALLYKVNLTHIATKVPARWAKVPKELEETVTAPAAAPRGEDNEAKRELTCPKCEHRINVKHTQLRVADGYRTIYCTSCRWNGRATQLQCTCGVPWYLCATHTTDPPVHRSKKPPKKLAVPAAGAKAVMFSTRPAPTVRGNDFATARKRTRAAQRNLHEHRQEIASTRIAVSATTLARWNKSRKLIQETELVEQALESRKRKAEDTQEAQLAPPRRMLPRPMETVHTVPADNESLRNDPLTAYGYEYLASLSKDKASPASNDHSGLGRQAHLPVVKKNSLSTPTHHLQPRPYPANDLPHK